MDNFGIDLDKVLNDFEEQENKRELESLAINAENEIHLSVFTEEKCDSSSVDRDDHGGMLGVANPKNCLPSTNNILSSINKYCKHFLRENVANHVCCNDSKVHNKDHRTSKALPDAKDAPEIGSSLLAELNPAENEGFLGSMEIGFGSLNEGDECTDMDDFENNKPETLKTLDPCVTSVIEDTCTKFCVLEHLVESEGLNAAEGIDTEQPNISGSSLKGDDVEECKEVGLVASALLITETELLVKEAEAESLGAMQDGLNIGWNLPSEYAALPDENKNIEEILTDSVQLKEEFEASMCPAGKMLTEEDMDRCENKKDERIIIIGEISQEEGQVQGEQEGQVQGEQEDQVQGEQDDQLQGEQEGQVQDEQEGQVQGGQEGQVQGEQEGQVQGEQEDQVQGEQEGQVQGELEGQVQGEQEGQVQGEQEGQVHGEQDGQVQDEQVKLVPKSSEAGNDLDVHPPSLNNQSLNGINGCDSENPECETICRPEVKSPDSMTTETLFGIKEFNLSSLVSDDVETKIDDDCDDSLKILQNDVATFIDAIGDEAACEFSDQINLEDSSEDNNPSKTTSPINGHPYAVSEKLQALLREEQKHLLGELVQHKNSSAAMTDSEDRPSKPNGIDAEEHLPLELSSDQLSQNSDIQVREAINFIEGLSMETNDEGFDVAGDDLSIRNGFQQQVDSEIADRRDETERFDANVLEERSPPNSDRSRLDQKFEQTFQIVEVEEVDDAEKVGKTQRDHRPQGNQPVRQHDARPDHPRSLQLVQPQFFHAPSRCSNIDLPITELGKVSPPWLPDSSTNKCLQCETSFSFLRRRHHCRACGLIFCNECCNVRYPLEYMSNKEERVCCKCFVDFNRASSYQNMLSSMSIPTPTSRPNPGNPSEYCSTIPPPLQATPSDPLPPVMVPSGVLRKQGVTRQNAEGKQVMFSDGIRPGGDLVHLDDRREGGSAAGTKKKKSSRSAGSSSQTKKQTPPSSAQSSSSPVIRSTKPSKSTANDSPNSFWVEGSLPPLVVMTPRGPSLDRSASNDSTFAQAIDANNRNPVTFALNPNLMVTVKVITKNCCVKKDLWCFATQGLCTVGQDEVVILLEYDQAETSIPLEIFQAISSVYSSASSGAPIDRMNSIVLQVGGARPEPCGFLFVHQTIQCVQNVPLPSPPYLFGIFIKQSELAWARAFPLRLFFRLGAEFRYYPCPLFGVRSRQSVYGEVGHTIMNLLSDFRNFQYTISAVDEMVIHVEEKLTTILIPRYKRHQMLKALSNSDDHVLAMAGNFSFNADSHLICIQNEEGSYQTQAMNIQGKLRSVTGASFVVFNAALKSASGYTAKMSIIEDGLMVQITPEDMAALKQALSVADDFTITCGLASSSSSSSGNDGVFDGVVSLKWFSERTEKSSDMLSPIDRLNLSQVEHKRIHSSLIHVTSAEGFALVWTGLFFLNSMCACQPLRSEVEKFSELLASSCCKCIVPHLASLCPSPLSRLSLRITVGSDQIGYEAGIGGSQLNNNCLVALDNIVIPLLHGSSFATRSYDTSIELLFVIAKPINA